MDVPAPPEEWLARTRPVPPAEWLERVRAGAPGLLSDQPDDSVIDWHAPEGFDGSGAWPESYAPVDPRAAAMSRPRPVRLTNVHAQHLDVPAGQARVQKPPSSVPLWVHQLAGDGERLDARVGSLAAPRPTALRYRVMNRAHDGLSAIRAWVQRANSPRQGDFAYARTDKHSQAQVIRQTRTSASGPVHLTIHETRRPPNVDLPASILNFETAPAQRDPALVIREARDFSHRGAVTRRDPLRVEHLTARIAKPADRRPARIDPHRSVALAPVSSSVAPETEVGWPTLLEEGTSAIPDQVVNLGQPQARLDREQWGDGWNV
jgi:hypothetical protein